MLFAFPVLQAKNVDGGVIFRVPYMTKRRGSITDSQLDFLRTGLL